MQKVLSLLKEIVTPPVFVYYFLRGVVLYSFAVLLVQQHWLDAVSAALIFVLMTVPVYLKEKYKTQTPLELDVAASFFVFLTLFLGSFQNFYEKFPWYDSVLHFLSGILLGMIGFVLVYLLNQGTARRIHLSPGFISFFAVTFSISLSVFWELYEYAGDVLLGFNMQESGLPDTMGDLAVNIVGALIVALIGYLWMHKYNRLPFVEKMLAKYRRDLL